MKGANGTLLSKPEAGLVASHLLNGLARCGVCGGSLTFYAKPPRYYCAERARRGPAACANDRGVPVAALDEAVRERLYTMLSSDGQMVADLCEERDQRLRSEQVGQGDRREAALRDAALLEKSEGSRAPGRSRCSHRPELSQPEILFRHHASPSDS